MLSLEICLEITILTIKDTIETCFEEKRLSWSSVVFWNRKYGNMILSSKNNCRSKALIANIFIKNIFVMVNL